MGRHLKLGWVDLDKYSIVSLINRTIMLVVQRMMMHDEEFKLEVMKANEHGKLVVATDVDLLRAWKNHND